MALHRNFVASILLIAGFAFNAFGQQISPLFLDGQERRVIKVGEPVLLFERVSVELKSMTIDSNRLLKLNFAVKNVNFPGSIAFAATTRIMRDDEGLQYERQTTRDWSSGGKRLLKGTELESAATISLKDNNRNQRAINPVLISSALRLSFYHKDSLINPYRRNVFQQAPVTILEIDKDELQAAVGKYKPKSVPAPKRVKLPASPISIEKFEKLKFGMSYVQVAKILGGDGTKTRSIGYASSSDKLSQSIAYEWRSVKVGTISCAFVDDGLELKSFFRTPSRDLKSADLTIEKYEKLKKGITYEESRKILGSHGVLYMTTASSRRVVERFSWGSEKGTISLTFRDGALLNKRKTGLN